jgi:hypothetical protein
VDVVQLLTQAGRPELGKSPTEPHRPSIPNQKGSTETTGADAQMPSSDKREPGRQARGSEARQYIDLKLGIQRPTANGKLGAVLTVRNRSTDKGLWERILSDAHWTGYAWFTENGELLGTFKVSLGNGQHLEDGVVSEALDLTWIRTIYLATPYQRDAIGSGRLGVVVFLKFDEGTVEDLESIRSTTLHSNTVYIVPSAWH